MSRVTNKELARQLEETRAELAEAKAEVQRLQHIHLGPSVTMMPLLEGLLNFGLEAYKGIGPRMTQINIRLEGENLPIMHLWATIGEETPLTRIAHLLALLDATQDERVTLLRHEQESDQARRKVAEEERDQARAELAALTPGGTE